MSKDVKILKEQIVRIRTYTEVSQITVSRSVKMPRGGGDVFVSLTGNYGDQNESVGPGLSLEDARVATHLLGLEANILAFQQARSAGILSGEQMETAIRHTRNNFGQLLMDGKDK